MKSIELVKFARFLPIPNSIEISLHDGKQYFFTSFLHRQAAYEKFLQLKQGEIPVKGEEEDEKGGSSTTAGDSASNSLDKTNFQSKREKLLAANARRIKQEKAKEEKKALEDLKAQQEPVEEPEDFPSETPSSPLPWAEQGGGAKANLERIRRSSQAPESNITKKVGELKLQDDEDGGKSDEKKRKGKSSPPNETAEAPRAFLYDHPTFRLPDEKVTKLTDRFVNLESGSRLDTRNRRFLFEGPLKRQGRWSIVDRAVFLLSDILVIAKTLSGDRLQLKQIIQLEYLIIDARPVTFQKNELSGTKLPLPFRVIQVKPKVESFILSAPTPESRREWIRALGLATSRLSWLRNNPACKGAGWYFKNVRGTAHWAALLNETALLEYLAQNDPESINEFDQEGSTPLHIAVQANHSNLIPLLISKGADIKARDGEGRTAITLAAELGIATCVEELLKSPLTALDDFHPMGDRRGANARPRSATKKAKVKKDKKSVPSTGFPTQINLREISGLWRCAALHQVQWEKCLRLLTQFADKELAWRFEAGQAGALYSVLDDRDENGVSLMELCVALGMPEVVEALVACGASVNSINWEGITPLGLAAQQGFMEVIIALIQNGAQPNLRPPPALHTALHYSASLEVASYLVANGARMNLKTSDGVRVTEVFSTPSQLATLRAAEDLNQNRPAANSQQTMKSPPAPELLTAIPHCLLCSEGFGLQEKRRDWCRNCQQIVCSYCLLHRVNFLDENSLTASGSAAENLLDSQGSPIILGIEGRVCDGCFNIVNYLPQTVEKKKKRRVRVKEEISALEKITEFLTAVKIEGISSDLLAIPSSDRRPAIQTAQGIIEIQENPEEIRFNKHSSSSGNSIFAPEKEKQQEKAIVALMGGKDPPAPAEASNTGKPSLKVATNAGGGEKISIKSPRSQKNPSVEIDEKSIETLSSEKKKKKSSRKEKNSSMDSTGNFSMAEDSIEIPSSSLEEPPVPGETGKSMKKSKKKSSSSSESPAEEIEEKGEKKKNKEKLKPSAPVKEIIVEAVEEPEEEMVLDDEEEEVETVKKPKKKKKKSKMPQEE